MTVFDKCAINTMMQRDGVIILAVRSYAGAGFLLADNATPYNTFGTSLEGSTALILTIQLILWS